MTEPTRGVSNDLDDRPEVLHLFANLRPSLPGLEKMLAECRSHWGSEDAVYRFYHHSVKVYSWQEATLKIASALQALAPERQLNESFMAIVRDGTGRPSSASTTCGGSSDATHRRGVLPRAVFPRDGGPLREAVAPTAPSVAERLGGVSLPLRREVASGRPTGRTRPTSRCSRRSVDCGRKSPLLTLEVTWSR